jgi:PAS domain S-box-containing protein
VQYFRSALGRYVAAFLAIVAAIVLTYLISYAIGGGFRGIFLVDLLAILLAAWNGYGPGAAATIVTVFAVPRLFKPTFTPAQVEIGSFGLLLLVSLLVSRISATRTHVEELLRKSKEQSDDRARQRTADLERASTALGESEGRFSFFMRHLPGAAWMKDLQGRYVYANPTAERIFRTPLDQLRGKADDEIFPPEVAAQFQENDRRALADRSALETIEVLPQEDGDHYSMVSKFPIFGADGTPLMVGGVAIDITGRRKAEQEAHNRLAELEHLYKTAPVGLAFLDTQLRYVRLNEQLAAINGAPLSAHLGRTLREILPPPLADTVEPLYRQVLDCGEPILNREVHGISLAQPGVERDFLVSYSPVKTDDGIVLGVQSLVQDITQRNRFDEQLRHTAKLESLGILAGGVAHDFNNLLTGILGNASLARDSVAGDLEVRRMLQDVVAASERAAHLTRQLLAYAGKGQFVVGPLDISRLVREISPLIRTSIGKNVQLQFELKEPIALVAADASQIQQLVMNLAINGGEAISADESGSVLIRASEQVVDEAYIRTTPFVVAENMSPGKYVCLTVQDTGGGMDEATRKRIFDPFFTTKFTGRGLGLAAALGIVRGHRGALTVWSLPGRGSTFQVFLPVTDQPAPLEPAVSSPALRRAGELVLVVDDEEMVRRTAQAALERHGYRVLTAESGHEGLAVFLRFRYEICVILLDLTMPGLDGEETFSELKKISPEVKVILSSGYNEVETLRRFAGNAPSGFMQKPYTAAALIGKVNGVLQSSGGRR